MGNMRNLLRRSDKLTVDDRHRLRCGFRRKRSRGWFMQRSRPCTVRNAHELRDDRFGLRPRKLIMRNESGYDFVQRYSKRKRY